MEKVGLLNAARELVADEGEAVARGTDGARAAARLAAVLLSVLAVFAHASAAAGSAHVAPPDNDRCLSAVSAPAVAGAVVDVDGCRAASLSAASGKRHHPAGGGMCAASVYHARHHLPAGPGLYAGSDARGAVGPARPTLAAQAGPSARPGPGSPSQDTVLRC
nr:hypothetical protein KPHV_86660 [Kitasatospora purpeofusca]